MSGKNHFTNPQLCTTITAVTIEFTNAIEPRSHASISVAIVVAASAFFFIPTTLIVLGYYSSQPTGTLISPLPAGILSDQRQSLPVISTPTVTPDNASIIAAPNDATISANTSITPEIKNNIIDHTATIPEGISEAIVTNPDIRATSQIYLSPKDSDKSVYSVKSKSEGQFIISSSTTSDVIRYIDYHIVNP